MNSTKVELIHSMRTETTSIELYHPTPHIAKMYLRLKQNLINACGDLLITIH